MRDNPVKAKLQAGETAFGTMVFEFATPGLPAILKAAGAEYVLYDMEHSGLSMEQVKQQFALTRGLGLVPLVRPPAKTYAAIALLLDLGAMGLMLPMVDSAEEASEIVSWTRYPPRGERGAMFGNAQDDFLGGPVPAKIAAAEARTMVFPMIESGAGLDQVEAIAAVDGVDGLHLGQLDLSISLGVPGEGKHPRMVEAIDSIAAAARKHGRFAGALATSLDAGHDFLARGFRMISYSMDIVLLQKSLAEGLAALREG